MAAKGERDYEMRSALYHAVARGDVDGAQDAMNLMMLAGIDDVAIIAANKASRPLPDTPVAAFVLPQGPVGTFMDGLRTIRKPKARRLRRGQC